MSLKNVMLHVSAENFDPAAGAARYALGMSAAFGAHLTGLMFELDVYSPSGAYFGQLAADGRAAVEARNRAARAMTDDLRRAADAAHVPADVITRRAHAHDVPDAVAERARLCDVSVVGIETEGLLNDRTIAEHVLFQSGRPIIAAPKNCTGFASERIVVAWDYSRAAARAVADAMPLLKRAAEVWIVTFADEKRIDTALTADDLATALARHGVGATYETVAISGAEIGQAILSYAQQCSADLLVMGGYGHSRFREFVLGGATRGVLQTTHLPVLMSQ